MNCSNQFSSITRLGLRAQGFELGVIDLFPGDEEIESRVELFEVGILGHLGVYVLHVGRILEFGDLDPKFFVFGEFDS
jgi:hypothetical protein